MLQGLLRGFILATLLSSFSVAFAQSQPYYWLLTNLNNTATPGYGRSIGGSPYLYIQSLGNRSISDAVRYVMETSPDVAKTPGGLNYWMDQANIVISATKSIDSRTEDTAIQTANRRLVRDLGLDRAVAMDRIGAAIPLDPLQAAQRAVSDQLKRVAAFAGSIAVIVAVGLVLAFGLVLIPLLIIAPPVSLVGAALLLGGLEVGGAILSSVNNANREVIQQNLPAIMSQMLSPREIQAGSPVDWIDFSFEGFYGVWTRTQRAAFSFHSLAGLSLTPQGSPQKVAADKISTVAVQQFAGDLLVTEIFLAVISRQIAGVAAQNDDQTRRAIELVRTSREERLLGGLIVALSKPQQMMLKLAVNAMEKDPALFSGLTEQGYRDQRTRDERRKEVMFTVYWLKAGLSQVDKLNATDALPKQAEQLGDWVDRVMGRGSRYRNFNETEVRDLLAIRI